jgi:hypothetical protein
MFTCRKPMGAKSNINIYFRVLNQKSLIFATKFEPKASIRSCEAPLITHLDTPLVNTIWD